MSKRESGTYPLRELTSDIDGSQAFETTPEFRADAMAGSWDMATAEIDESIMWTCDDLDDDDLDISITPDLLALLWTKARAYDRIMAVCGQCEGCTCC